MGAISFFSCSGAPGSTTVSLATTAALTATSAPEPVMIEMAASGGVVAGQYDLPVEPGLTSLTLALGGEPPELLMHAQELPGGIPVVVAPPSGSKTSKLLDARSALMARYLAEVEATVLVDCGRISSASPVIPVLDVSTLVGVVVRPTRENFQLAATTLAEINAGLSRPLPAGWVIVGSCPWPHEEVNRQYGVPILTTIAEDHIGAEAVAGLRRLRRRSPLARSIQSFADDIAKHLRVASPEAPLGYVANPSPPSSSDTSDGLDAEQDPEQGPEPKKPAQQTDVQATDRDVKQPAPATGGTVTEPPPGAPPPPPPAKPRADLFEPARSAAARFEARVR